MDPKAIRAGGTPWVSFAILGTWMTPSSVKGAASHRLDCLDPENIVDIC